MAAFELGDLQLAILRVLWERGEESAAGVHAALWEARGLAPTTIATMLVKLEKKGVVEHRVEGRAFVYRARVGRDEVRRSMVGALVQRLFHGDGAALVNHLLEAHDVDPGELEALQSKIRARQKKKAGGEAAGGRHGKRR